MAMNFPDAPADGAIFTGPNGLQYVFSNGVWMQSSAAQIKIPARANPNLILNPNCYLTQQNGNAIGTAMNYYIADQWVMQGAGIALGGRSNIDASKPYGQAHNTAARASLLATDFLCLTQPIEGFSFQSLGWGLPAEFRKPAVLNFKARASAAGTYSGAVREGNPGTASFPFNFTIAAGDVNVWKEFTIAIPPPSTTAAWATVSNQMGGFIQFVHSAGSNFVAPAEKQWQSGGYFAGPGVTNNSAVSGTTLQITDVQFLADPDGVGAAPPFVAPKFSDIVADCQRYWAQDPSGAVILGGGAYAAGLSWYQDIQFPVIMRAVPAVNFSYTTSSNVTTFALGLASIMGCRYNFTTPSVGSFYAGVGWTANARLI